jgi:acetyl-CoA C-acetyltransferase
MFSQFEGAEMVAEKFNVTRATMDEMAFESHRRAHEATQAGRFKREIVPIKGLNKAGEEILLTQDEGIRWPADREKLQQLKTLKKGGRLTAATASQISDGASAILVVNERGLRKLGVSPRARIVALALAGDDPVMCVTHARAALSRAAHPHAALFRMLSAPIPATRYVLQRAGLALSQIDLYEVNEAFASVPGAWAQELGADKEKLNVNGGAMALGHPLGCTGTKLMTTLLHELERRGGRYGLQAICEGGGTANATIIERCSSPLTTAKL